MVFILSPPLPGSEPPALMFQSPVAGPFLLLVRSERSTRTHTSRTFSIEETWLNFLFPLEHYASF